MVEILIPKRANINALDIIYLITRSLLLIKKIFKKQRKLKKKNNALLHYAAKYDSKDVGELLISKGANINVKDIIYLNIKKILIKVINNE